MKIPFAIFNDPTMTDDEKFDATMLSLARDLMAEHGITETEALDYIGCILEEALEEAELAAARRKGARWVPPTP